MQWGLNSEVIVHYIFSNIIQLNIFLRVHNSALLQFPFKKLVCLCHKRVFHIFYLTLIWVEKKSNGEVKNCRKMKSDEI